jgi:hypothetical protein
MVPTYLPGASLSAEDVMALESLGEDVFNVPDVYVVKELSGAYVAIFRDACTADDFIIRFQDRYKNVLTKHFWKRPAKTGEAEQTSTNTGMAAAKPAQIAAEMSIALRLTGTLATDINYWRNSVIEWARQLRHA